MGIFVFGRKRIFVKDWFFVEDEVLSNIVREVEVRLVVKWVVWVEVRDICMRELEW